MTSGSKLTKADFDRYRANYLNEMDGIALYRALAGAERDEKRAAIFEKLGRAEERHANRWAGLLKTAGEAVPEYRRTRPYRRLAPTGTARTPGLSTEGCQYSRTRCPKPRK